MYYDFLVIKVGCCERRDWQIPRRAEPEKSAKPIHVGILNTMKVDFISVEKDEFYHSPFQRYL